MGGGASSSFEILEDMNFLKENSAEPPAADEVPLRSILELSNTTISAAERGLEVTIVEAEVGDFLAFFFVVVVVVAEVVADNEEEKEEEGVMRERKSRSCSGISSVVASAFRFFDPAPVAPVAAATVVVVVAVLGLKMVLTSFFFLRGAGAAMALAAAFLSITRSMLCYFLVFRFGDAVCECGRPEQEKGVVKRS